MFQNAYQSGNFLEIFDAKSIKENDKNNDKLFKVSHPTGINKTYDKSIKSYIFDVQGGSKTKVQFPKEDRYELGLTQSFLVFQVFMPKDNSFSLELIITDTSKTKRRLMFTSNAKEIEKNHFHARLPLDCLQRETWLHLSFDLINFLSLFTGSTFRSLDSFTFTGNCKIRKIFTMKHPLMDSSINGEDISLPYLDCHAVSKVIDFPPGIPYSNQQIALSTLQKCFSDHKDESSLPRKGLTILRSVLSTPLLPHSPQTQSKPREKEGPTPIKMKLRRNNSLYSEETSRFISHNGKDSFSRISALSRRPSLLSTADSRNESLISPKLMPQVGRGAFFSPNQHRILSEKKEGPNIEALHFEESIVTPKGNFTRPRIISPKAATSNSFRKEVKSRVTSSIKKNEKEKEQEVSQEKNKRFSLNKKLRIKTKFNSDFASLMSPKTPSMSTLTSAVSSTKAHSDKNPWAFDELALRRALSPKPSNIQTPAQTPVKPNQLYNSSFYKKRQDRSSLSGLKKDTMSTLSATPKTSAPESERFSTFSRGESCLWGGQKEIMEGDENDEIESIEENLEYELNSHTSMCKSRGILESVDRNGERKEPSDFVLQRKGKKEGGHNIYEIYAGDGDTLYYHNERSHMLGILGESEGENEKKVIDQVEEQMKNILANKRPFSPPFASKGRRSSLIN